MCCKNCGSTLKENAKYCHICGSKVEAVPSLPKDSQVNNSNDFDERFIKSYIGNNADIIYENVKRGGFELWALVFGIGYFAYRKIYSASVLIIILSNFLVFIIPPLSAYTSSLLGCLFCPIYKWDITRKLRKIKRDNPTASEEQLLAIAKQKGGTSIINAIVFFGIYLLFIILYLKGAI